MRNTLVLFVSVVVCTLLTPTRASEFDDCHLKCAATKDFDDDNACGTGCSLAVSADPLSFDCKSACMSKVGENLTSSCIEGCKYELEKQTPNYTPETDPEQDAENSIFNPFKMVFIRFRWTLSKDLANGDQIEAAQQEPFIMSGQSPMNEQNPWSHFFLQRIACVRRHHLAFPFLLSLCFLLLSTVILLMISVLYRIREARKRSGRVIDRLPKYHEITQIKANPVCFEEAGPLPEKKPLDV